jgi:hypothetical protein
MSDASDVGPNDGFGVAPHPARVVWSYKLEPSGESREEFSFRLALAALLIEEKVHVNDFGYETDWPPEARKCISVHVDCSDVFVWGAADDEPLLFSDLRSLWDHYVQDKDWGCDVWCIKKRGQMPQRPVVERILAGGKWDLASMGLKANYYDGVSMVRARQKYEAYCAWEVARCQKPRPFDAQWWAGWNEFIKANPGWYIKEWSTEEGRRVGAWKAEHGYGASHE